VWHVLATTGCMEGQTSTLWHSAATPVTSKCHPHTAQSSVLSNAYNKHSLLRRRLPVMVDINAYNKHSLLRRRLPVMVDIRLMPSVAAHTKLGKLSFADLQRLMLDPGVHDLSAHLLAHTHARTCRGV